ncbi:MAG: hypothetical protein ABSE08_20705 [Syntrophobacteraceae bacterium]
MTQKDRVAVRVLYLPGKTGGCACMSGAGLSSPEAIQELLQKCNELKETMAAANPGKTSLEVVDLRLQPAEKSSEAGRLLVAGQYPSPLVVIDGEPRFAGSIQINRIVKEVGKILNG